MSMVKNKMNVLNMINQAHNLTIGLSEWFRVELGGIQKASNLKTGLKKRNLNVFHFLIKIFLKVRDVAVLEGRAWTITSFFSFYAA